jgi:hypothetical protein
MAWVDLRTEIGTIFFDLQGEDPYEAACAHVVQRKALFARLKKNIAARVASRACSLAVAKEAKAAMLNEERTAREAAHVLQLEAERERLEQERAARALGRTVAGVCANPRCGKTFARVITLGPIPEYCRASCAKHAANRRFAAADPERRRRIQKACKQRRHERSHFVPETRTCPTCGASFQVTDWRHEHKVYCKTSCRVRACQKRNPKSTTKPTKVVEQSQGSGTS